MRTGKYQFNYQAYAIEWAINIIANERGYSVNRAYQINRVFGTLVEHLLKYYQTQILYAKKFSVISGTYDNMIEEFENFAKNLKERIDQCKEEIDQWLNNTDFKSLGKFQAVSNAAFEGTGITDANTVGRLYDISGRYAGFRDYSAWGTRVDPYSSAFNDNMNAIYERMNRLMNYQYSSMPNELKRDIENVIYSGNSIVRYANTHGNLINRLENEFNSSLMSSRYTNQDFETLISQYNGEFIRGMDVLQDDYTKNYNNVLQKYRRYLTND